jgi:hypothetical protein
MSKSSNTLRIVTNCHQHQKKIAALPNCAPHIEHQRLNCRPLGDGRTRKLDSRANAEGEALMEYRLLFYDFVGQIMGVKPIDASDTQTAIAVAIGLAESAADQRTELWDGDRLVMRRAFSELTSAN